MFCVFPQGRITSSWCDGPVSTSTDPNRRRHCTHHAKLRMTQFLLQPAITHYYLLSWIKSMTWEKQRPWRVYWGLYMIWPWLLDRAKWITILWDFGVKSSFNYLFANTGELWPALYVPRPHMNVSVDVGLNVREEFSLKRCVHADEYCWVVVYFTAVCQLCCFDFQCQYSIFKQIRDTVGTLAVSKPMK